MAKCLLTFIFSTYKLVTWVKKSWGTISKEITILVHHFGSSFWLSKYLAFLSECTKELDCPNNGENYKCIANFCTCDSGHVLDGTACVGMLHNRYLRSNTLTLSHTGRKSQILFHMNPFKSFTVKFSFSFHLLLMLKKKKKMFL